MRVDWEQRARLAGAGLIAIGLLGLAVALAIAAYRWATGAADAGLQLVAVRLGVGGLVLALIGAMLLLLAPDTLPPGERPP